MAASTEAPRCVVCVKNAAVLYCQQDDAHLCKACDEQVHSANPLAARHQRVPIKSSEPVKEASLALSESKSVFESEPSAAPAQAQEAGAQPEFVFDDDDFFAVPDVDLPSSVAADDSAMKNALGKTFVSDEFDFGEIDPLWLDRLDVGLDRLPSDILDSLVPEAPPPAKPAAPPAAEPHPRPPSPSQGPVHPAPPPPPPAPASHHHVPHAHAPMQPVQHMHHYAPHTMVPHYAPPAEAVASKWGPAPAAPAEPPIDIDTYMPQCLLPVDASMRLQQLRARREKLERFREKKRNRHFKKTIRYASRKAYAEVRPRIKGRFARKDEVAAMRAAGLLPAA